MVGHVCPRVRGAHRSPGLGSSFSSLYEPCLDSLMTPFGGTVFLGHRSQVPLPRVWRAFQNNLIGNNGYYSAAAFDRHQLRVNVHSSQANPQVAVQMHTHWHYRVKLYIGFKQSLLEVRNDRTSECQQSLCIVAVSVLCCVHSSFRALADPESNSKS